MYINVHQHFLLFLPGIRQVLANKTKRDQTIALKAAGVSKKKIVKQLKVCRKTVCNTWNQFLEAGTTSGKPIPVEMRTVCTRTMLFATKRKME